MQLSIKGTITILSCLSLLGCYLDERDPIIKDGIESLTFPCYDSTSQYYFRGKFGEDSICLYENKFDCWSAFDQWSSWVTTSPTTTIGDTLPGNATTWLSLGISQWVQKDDGSTGGYVGQDYYEIHTPEMAAGPSTDSLVMAFLQPGYSDFWQHEHDDLGIPQGLEVYIFKHHYNSKFKKKKYQLHLTSARGNQIGSYIEVLKLELTQIGNHVEGEIQLRFKCKMYLDIHGKYDGNYDGDFIGDLTGEVHMPITYDR